MYIDILSTCMKEKFGRLYWVYYAVLGVLSLLVSEVISIGILIAAIIYTATQISRIFCFTGINCINNGYYSFRKKRERNMVATALLANIPWLLLLVAKIIFTQPHMVFFAVLIGFYLTFLGIVLGKYIINEVICYGLMLLIFFFSMQKTLIHELYFRYITPLLLLRGDVNWFNVFSICIVCFFEIILIFFYKRKMKFRIFLLLIASLCAVVLCELNYENKINNKENIIVDRGEYSLNFNPVLIEEDMVHIADLFNETEKVLNNYGYDFKTTDYNMEYSIYFPWESSKEKVLMNNDNNMCRINFYTDSLCNLADKELIVRYIYSLVDSDTGLQEIAVTLLAEEISAKIIDNEGSLQITQFLYDNLVETYGKCVSPKQCVIAECLRNDPKSFFTIYQAFGSVTSLSEIDIEKLEISNAFKILFRRAAE